MKIKRPASPINSGPEPIDPLKPGDLRKTVKGGGFADALSRLENQTTRSGATKHVSGSKMTRVALSQIAGKLDLTSETGAAQAVLESARYMIGSRLNTAYRETEQGKSLVQNLSEYVANDPLLKSKLLSILKKMKTG